MFFVVVDDDDVSCMFVFYTETKQNFFIFLNILRLYMHLHNLYNNHTVVRLTKKLVFLKLRSFNFLFLKWISVYYISLYNYLAIYLYLLSIYTTVYVYLRYMYVNVSDKINMFKLCKIQVVTKKKLLLITLFIK